MISLNVLSASSIFVHLTITSTHCKQCIPTLCSCKKKSKNKKQAITIMKGPYRLWAVDLKLHLLIESNCSTYGAVLPRQTF